MWNKKVQHTIIILFALVLFSCAGESKDAANDINDDRPVESTESNRAKEEEASFLALEKPIDELTTEQKEAFQARAIQKFQDFTDYVNIISDPDVANDLKDHSIALASALFKNDSLSSSDSTMWSMYNETPVPLFLDSLKTSSKPIFLLPKKIEFVENLQIDTVENSYKGIIETTIISKGKETNYHVEVHVIQTNKAFGENDQTVIEVRLGNIY